MIVEIGPNNCGKCKYKTEAKYSDAKLKCKNKKPETEFLPQEIEEPCGYGYWVCSSYKKR